MNNHRKRIVIIGATSAIAEHCARLWVQSGACDMVLVARDRQRAERVAADLQVRGPQSRIDALTSDFLDAAEIERTVDRVWGAGVDLVLIAHGILPDQHECEQDLAVCRAALDVNALSPALFAEAFARRMAARNEGTLVVIGSVAGDRGRKSNYVYGAAKGLLDRYLQGLRHRFAGTRVKVAIIKPGPTDTPMTAHMKDGPKRAPVDSVARDIVDALERGKEVIYTPGKWRLIMMIIRHLPGFVFNKLNI